MYQQTIIILFFLFCVHCSAGIVAVVAQGR
jgi:hypothetical protein